MPIYPPRNSPTRKIEIFNKKANELNREVSKGKNLTDLSSKIEKVRTAYLNLLKARLKLLENYTEKDENNRNELLKKKYRTEKTQWENATHKGILDLLDISF